MSRSGTPTVVSVRARAVASRPFPVWHVAWLTALGGCFYVKPIPDVDVNDPPVIVFPVDDPALVRIQDGHVVMSIGATDDEGGPITFEWPDLDDVPYQVEAFTHGPIEGVRVQVDDPGRLRSDLLTALVVDDDPANLVPVHFQVVTP